jgi:hypothetical protein
VDLIYVREKFVCVVEDLAYLREGWVYVGEGLIYDGVGDTILMVSSWNRLEKTPDG